MLLDLVDLRTLSRVFVVVERVCDRNVLQRSSQRLLHLCILADVIDLKHNIQPYLIAPLSSSLTPIPNGHRLDTLLLNQATRSISIRKSCDRLHERMELKTVSIDVILEADMARH